ncbi:MAG: ATP-binding protein [Parcubacteria group bacterium]
MIRSFSCKNFYSFADESAVNFVVNEKAPKKESYIDSVTRDRISKALVVIGPNASGKTNLLKVLPFLKWLIIDSFKTDPGAKIPVRPFLFHTLEKKPTELSVEFEIGNDIYDYFFSLDENRILYEELKIKNKTKQKLTTKTLFIREWNNKSEKYDFNDKGFDLPKGFENENFLRNNASVISAAIRLNHDKSRMIGNFWLKVETNVVEAGWLGDHLFRDNKISFIDALGFFSDNEKLKGEAEKLLKRFDIGLESFDIKKEKKENGISINAKVVHSFEEKKYELPIHYESSGTRQLFILLKTILQVLANGGVAVIDELDVNLHPEMISALFDLFISSETNPKKAQIIFSTHSHSILSDLDKYQIILTAKNEKGSSEAWRLDEVKGVRADDNYYSKYIAGAYGAVPQID